MESGPGVRLGSGSKSFGYPLASTSSGGAGGAGVEINRGGHTATNNYSVKKRENVSIGWASGTDFGSNHMSWPS